MELKRTGSTIAISDNKIKRTRKTEGQRLPAACLHCGNDTHSWVGCWQQCRHCRGFHKRNRCPKLPVALYTPGPFRVSTKEDTPPIHSERSAMIDTASSPFESNITVGHHTPFPVEGGGSQRTGSNEMPLSPKKPIGTSWPTKSAVVVQEA